MPPLSFCVASYYQEKNIGMICTLKTGFSSLIISLFFNIIFSILLAVASKMQEHKSGLLYDEEFSDLAVTE